MEVWKEMVHVFQIFSMLVIQSDHAVERAGDFIKGSVSSSHSQDLVSIQSTSTSQYFDLAENTIW